MFDTNICQKRLDMWLLAEEALVTGKEYRIGNRSLVKSDLKEVYQAIRFWQKELEKSKNKGKRRKTYVGIPMD